jgi:hypothetical protein
LDVEAEVVEENLHNGRGNGKGKKSKPKREPRWSMRDLEREARAMRTGKGVKKLGGVRDVPIEDLRKRSEDLDLSSLSDEELDALDAADEEALANRGVKKDAAVSRVPAVLVSLELAGAIGPETHVYGTTAAHLYMKKKA